MHAPIAKVWIKVGEYGIPGDVAVVSNAPEMVYLGQSLAALQTLGMPDPASSVSILFLLLLLPSV